jgi:phosphatidylglycerophosphate synthase
VQPLIPLAWHPNAISLVNHALNWLLIGMALTAPHMESATWRIGTMALCCVVNFACMMLDCLDGMHARATQQCSKLGEVLDHGLDAIHVPLVSAGISYALRLDPWAVAVCNTLNALLYSAQLIVYHYTHLFDQTGGVEGQLSTSALYLVAAFLSQYPAQQLHVFWARQAISLISIGIFVGLIAPFVVRFGGYMWRKWLLLVALQIGYAVVYLSGGMSTIGFIMLGAAVSFRTSGSYVINSVLKTHYKGYDTSIVAWLAVLAWGHWCMEPLALSSFYSQLLSSSGGVFGVLLKDPLLGVSVQDVLPFMGAAHIILLNFRFFQTNYLKISNA